MSIILDIDRTYYAHRGALLSTLPMQGVWGVKVGNHVLKHGLEATLSQLSGKINVFVDLKHGDVDSRMDSIYEIYENMRGLAPMFVSVAGDIRPVSLDCRTRLRPMLVVVPLRSDMTEEDCRREYGCSRIERVERVCLKASLGKVHATTCPASLLPSIGMRLRYSFLHGVIATGARSRGVPGHEHIKPLTPEEALNHGATHVVIGREVNESPNPIATLKQLAGRCLAARKVA